MRNIWCAYYGKCLDKAIKENRDGFTCLGCQHSKNEEGRRIETDFLPYWLLLAAIFKPSLYHQYRGAEHNLYPWPDLCPDQQNP